MPQTTHRIGGDGGARGHGGPLGQAVADFSRGRGVLESEPQKRVRFCCWFPFKHVLRGSPSQDRNLDRFFCCFFLKNNWVPTPKRHPPIYRYPASRPYRANKDPKQQIPPRICPKSPGLSGFPKMRWLPLGFPLKTLDALQKFTT